MIITVDPDRGFHDRVKAAVAGTPWAQHALHVVDPAAVTDVVGVGAIPAVVVVGPHVALPAATSLAHRLGEIAVPVAVILVTEPTNDVLRSALRAGARDVLPPAFEDAELRSAIDRTGLADATEVLGPGLTVAVFSTKGGVGTSTVAANLSSRLAGRVGVEAVLLDLDVASADQSIMHGLTPSWTLQELVDGSIGTDAESLRQVLRPVSGGASSVLPGPLDPALAETIAGEAVARVIAASRTVAPIVVLDTSSSFDDRTLAGIDAADAIVVVSSLDVAALRALTVTLQTFDRIGIDHATVRVALVRADSKSGLQVSDVERAIGRPVDGRLPSSRAVVRSLNDGVPLAVSAPRSAYVRAIDELVENVLELASDELRQRADESSSSSWFPFGRGRSSDSSDGSDPADGSIPPRDGRAASPSTAGDVRAAEPTHPSVPPPQRPARSASAAPGGPPMDGPPVGGADADPSAERPEPRDGDQPPRASRDQSGSTAAAAGVVTRRAADVVSTPLSAVTGRIRGDVTTAQSTNGAGADADVDGGSEADADVAGGAEAGQRRADTAAATDDRADAVESDAAPRTAVALDALPPPRTARPDDDGQRRRFGLRR